VICICATGGTVESVILVITATTTVTSSDNQTNT
jgi:hypothetical protein